MSMSTLGVASVPRSSDFAQISQNENNRVMVEQNTMQTTFQKSVNAKSENVITKENAELGNQKFDAREKGQNEYVYEAEKKKKEQAKDGKVQVKGAGTSSFDIKI